MNLSVIVPVYNESQSLKLCLERLYAELKGLEEHISVTVVDSGSGDGTQRLAKELCQRFSWQFIEATLPEPSIGRVLQVAVNQQNCSNILFLPLDVDIPRLAWTILLEKIKQAGGRSFYGGFLKKYDPTNMYLKFYTAMLNLYAKYPRNIVWTNAIFVKSKLLKEVGLPQDGFLEDLLLSDRLKASGAEFILINEKLTASSRRYITRGILKQQWTNLKVIFMFRVLGAEPNRLKSIYFQK